MSVEPRRNRSRADLRRSEQGAPDGKERRNDDTRTVEIEIQNEERGLVAVLTNPLVVSTCFAIRNRLTGILRKYSTPMLIVDLAGVPYADTAGLGMLVEMRNLWRRDRREFVVRNPTPRVRRIIQTLDMDRSLNIE